MSKNLERVIQRAISDAAFRRQLQSNPEAALRGFKLTDSEVAALRSGDAGKLTSLGIDQRMSKTFSFGGDSLASRASIGGDLTTGSGSAYTGDVSGARNSSVDGENTSGAVNAADGDSTSGATRVVIPGSAGGTTAAFDPGFVNDSASVGDPMADTSGASVIADPDNPAYARGYIGGQAAPTSDALEDQSHNFAASRSADVGGSTGGYGANYPEHGGLAGQSADVASSARPSVIGDPDNPVNARGYIGEQGAGSATTSNIGDPDNPASARTFTGGQTASASDAIEDQSHAFAATRSADLGTAQAAPVEGSPEEFAFRDQGASAVTASNIGDPDNPAVARGYTGGESAPTSDALEDQSHAIAASRSDAFLTEGETSQYSDPNWSSDQAEDASHAFNPDSATTTPDDVSTTQHHEPDVPS